MKEDARMLRIPIHPVFVLTSVTEHPGNPKISLKNLQILQSLSIVLFSCFLWWPWTNETSALGKTKSIPYKVRVYNLCHIGDFRTVKPSILVNWDFILPRRFRHPKGSGLITTIDRRYRKYSSKRKERCRCTKSGCGREKEQEVKEYLYFKEDSMEQYHIPVHLKTSKIPKYKAKKVMSCLYVLSSPLKILFICPIDYNIQTIYGICQFVCVF